jgi:hypothetical protein
VPHYLEQKGQQETSKQGELRAASQASSAHSANKRDPQRKFLTKQAEQRLPYQAPSNKGGGEAV